MTWRFSVVSTAQERLLSRILQVLEVQRVSILSFTGEMDEAGTRITFVVSSGQDKAYRIKALLFRVEGVCEVSIETVPDGAK